MCSPCSAWSRLSVGYCPLSNRSRPSLYTKVMQELPHSILRGFFDQSQPEPRRILHGRGQSITGFERLNIDWYPPVVLLSAYKDLSDVSDLQKELLAVDKHKQINTIILQKRFEDGSPSQTLYGDDVESIIVSENSLDYEVHPGRRQNAGLFMDMRLVRRWLQENSAGKNVLNLFAYTCSLSVAALAGKATSVTSVDISKTSIEWGKRNFDLNGLDQRCANFIPYNLFTSWGRVKQYGRYDLVIVDPPTRQRGSFVAEKDYKSVIRRLSSLCNPNAEVIACLNSPFLGWEFLEELFDRHCPESVLVERMSVAPEYTEVDPARGLKICRFKLAANPI